MRYTTIEVFCSFLVLALTVLVHLDLCSLLRIQNSADKANAIKQLNESLSERKESGTDKNKIDFQHFVSIFFSEEVRKRLK